MEETLGSEKLIKMVRQMYEIRYFEKKVVELFKQNLIRGAVHVYLGEEAIAVGACAVLRDDDYIVSTHRGHGHCIAKKGDLNKMMAELLGKETGYCKGRGGSMHIADLDLGILGANGIVGGGIPISVGAGLSSKYQENNRVTVCFFGDGASNQGSFHESINLASTWRLPVIFICENNLYAVSVPTLNSTSVKDISDRARGYGIPGIIVDGNDVVAVYETVSKAVERARSGQGPTLIESKTYRWEGHYLGDPVVYRTKKEVDEWRKRDPIEKFKAYLIQNKVIDEEKVGEIEKETQKKIKQAESFAKNSPEPSPKNVLDDVYFPAEPIKEKTDLDAKREITYREALNEALTEEMQKSEKVLIFGEDIGLHGGAFRVTQGLFKKFGCKRVKDTPVSEAAIAGAAVGAALTGLRPIVEIMYVDFTTIALDQIVNQAAKMRYMFGGKGRLPVVFRTQCGGGLGGAAQHSQSLEAWFFHIPGLKVVIPSTPYDAKGLLKTAIRDDNPVIFIEYKRLYPIKGPVPEEEYLIPLGKASVKRKGEDVTVIATSFMVHEALSAADELAKEGISVEVVDPRTLFPFDEKTVLNSVKKTNRVVIAHEACLRGGIGGEIAAVIAEKAFDYLDTPIKRIGTLEVPIPYAKVLEEVVLPNSQNIITTVKEWFK